MALKKVSKKTVVKSLKFLTMTAYKDFIDKENGTIDSIILCPVNAYSEYSLGPTYNVIDNSLAYSFNRFGDLLFLERPEVDLNMWFGFKSPFVTWSLVKNKFISWMDKVQKLWAISWKRTGNFELIQLTKIQLEFDSSLLTVASCFWSSSLSFLLAHLQLHSITWSFYFAWIPKVSSQTLLLRWIF